MLFTVVLRIFPTLIGVFDKTRDIQNILKHRQSARCTFSVRLGEPVKVSQSGLNATVCGVQCRLVGLAARCIFPYLQVGRHGLAKLHVGISRRRLACGRDTSGRHEGASENEGFADFIPSGDEWCEIAILTDTCAVDPVILNL